MKIILFQIFNFFRKKTIDVINLLSKESSSFFTFYDIHINEINQQRIINVNDDNNLPEILKELNLNSSKNYIQYN